MTPIPQADSIIPSSGRELIMAKKKKTKQEIRLILVLVVALAAMGLYYWYVSDGF